MAAKKSASSTPVTKAEGSSESETTTASAPAATTDDKPGLLDSRRFKATLLGVILGVTTIASTAVMAVKGVATFDQYSDLTKWIGGMVLGLVGLYVAGVAAEDFAKAKATLPPTPVEPPSE